MNRPHLRRALSEHLEDRCLLAVMSIAADNADRSEGDSGTTSFTFEVSRVGDTGSSATVDYSVSGSGSNPANVDDFNGNILPSGQVIFFAGQTSKSITVRVAGDRIVESDETFTVNLSNPSSGSTIATASAGGTIRDDDAAPESTLSIVASVADRDEGNSGSTSFTFTVTRDGDTSQSATVDYVVAGTGTSPADVDDFNGNVLPSGQVTFFSGQSSKEITVNVSGDTIVEDDETFVVTLSNPSSGTTLETDSATGTIRDDDTPTGPSIDIVATNADRDEGNGGLTPFTFTITRTGDTSGSTTVDYSVTGTGTDPAEGSDFNGGFLPTGQVIFFSGQTSKTLAINVAGDFDIENDESFDVTLSNPTGAATLTTQQATGVIRDDDEYITPSLAMVAANADQSEGDSGTTNYTFTVTRSGSVSEAVSATYTVLGSGTNPADADDFSGAVLPSNSVTFAAGETTQTVSVPVNGDTVLEQDETFIVTLSNATGGAIISTASANAIIRNDDSELVPRLAIAAVNSDQSEGDSGETIFTFNVTRSEVTTGIVSVDYSVSGVGSNQATADDFSDDVFPSGSVIFNDGETSKSIEVSVRGDRTAELDESFVVTLSNPTGDAVVSTGAATGVIRDDDTPIPATLSIVAADADRSEGNSGTTPFTFTVNRTGDTSGSLTVDYSVVGSGSAPATVSDFNNNVFPSGQVTFFTGQTSKTITVFVSGDFAVESDEEFTVVLSNATGGAVIDVGSSTGTIRDDDDSASSLLSIAAENAQQDEGNSGTKTFTFSVTRTGNISSGTSVSYVVTGGDTDPANAADFVGSLFPSGTLNFLGNETTKTISIPVAGDLLMEPDESFVVSLINPSSNAVIDDANALGLIGNDDFSEIAVDITRPSSVVQTHVVAAAENPSSFLFQAVTDTTLSLEPIGFTPDANAMQILDSAGNPIGVQTGLAITANLIAGQSYAVMLPSQQIERTYLVGSSAGIGAVSIGSLRNIFRPTDTTADGFITALDALVIINRLNEISGGGVVTGVDANSYFFDVSGNGLVTELDALMVINRLNSDDTVTPQAGAEPVMAPLTTPARNFESDSTVLLETASDQLMVENKLVSPAPSSTIETSAIETLASETLASQILPSQILPSESSPAVQTHDSEHDSALSELLLPSDSLSDPVW
ncbi:beta strand repeat-containing protein [Rhodopirellula sallentina]|nr:Calx-beta domain-containing protein [Rhodopirellula sallentina]